MTKSVFKIVANSRLVRRDNECSLVPEAERAESGIGLLGISVGQDGYTLHQEDLPTDDMWLVVRYLKKKKKGYMLSEGDVIRLGRVRLTVKHIALNGQQYPVVIDNGRAIELPETTEACRICLCDSTSDEDPLITPCKCSGSMGFVHANCLKNWLKSKVDTRHSHKVSSYYWKDISCELCKHDLPSFIEIKGNTIQLVTVNYPSKPYMVLEEYKSDPTQSSGIHVITLNNKASLSIGRSHESDIKMSDISVSRTHATIRYLNGAFYLADTLSKFGTLVHLKNPHLLSNKDPVAIQVSRTLVTAALKKEGSLFSCCLGKKVAPTKMMMTKGDFMEDPEARPQVFQQEPVPEAVVPEE